MHTHKYEHGRYQGRSHSTAVMQYPFMASLSSFKCLNLLNLLYEHWRTFLNIKLGQGHGKMEEEIPAVFKEAS